MKKIEIISCFIIIILFTNCSKNDDATNEHPFLKLATYTEDGIEYSVQYNNNKPSSIEIYNNAASGNKINQEITYTADGKIQSIGTGTYTYNSSGQIATTTRLGLTGTIQYDSQGRVVRVSGSGFTTGNYSYQRNFIYTGTRLTSITELATSNGNLYVARIVLSYDSAGNVILFQLYLGNSLSNLTLNTTTNYTYDTKKNPWYKFFIEEMGHTNFFPLCFCDNNKCNEELGNFVINRIIYISPNNVLTKTKTYHSTSQTETYNYSYTYNSEEYPLTKEINSSEISDNEYFSFTYN